MAERILEVEADSLEQARKQAELKVPEGLAIVSEEILSNGKPRWSWGVADTIEAAFDIAESKLPSEADILEKQQESEPVWKAVTVEAPDEQSARAQAEQEIDKTLGRKVGFIDRVRYGEITLKKPGRKGFFGIGKKLNIYEVQVFEKAVVTIKYKRKAKIRLEFGESPESWAQKLKEKKDYRALAAVFNSQDYSKAFQKNRKKDSAAKILREAGTEAVNAIIEELDTGGVGRTDLAELLVDVGDPKAVPILKQKLDRGAFAGWSTESDIRRFVERYPNLVGEVEKVKCALCGKLRPVAETDGYYEEGEEKRFCTDTCWSKRGRVLKSGTGVDCPFYSEGICMAGGRDSGLCSLQEGSYLSSCHVYALTADAKP